MAAVAGGPNLGWLDEELRKHKGLVDELRTLADKQQVLLVDQSQRILSLEERLAKLQNQLLRLPDLEEALRYTRDEIVLMIGDGRQEAQKREADAVRARLSEREKDLKAFQEVQAELGRLAPLEQGMVVAHAESRRINEALMRLQVDAQGLGKAIGQAEDGRRVLADAISKIAVDGRQTAAELVDLRKVQQEIAARLPALGEGIARVERSMAELATMRTEVTAQQEQFAERARRDDRVRAQTFTEWGRRLDGYAHQLEGWADQLHLFADQHDKSRRVLRDIQTMAQEISQQQERLQQQQHLAEEQLRREMREGRSENDHRWAQEAERREQTLKAQAERDDAQELRLVDVEHADLDLRAALEAVATRVDALRGELAAAQTTQRQTQAASLQSFERHTASILRDLQALAGGGN